MNRKIVFLILFIVVSRWFFSADHAHPPADEVRFVEAVVENKMHIHPPGYILHVLTGKLFYGWVGDPYKALVLVSTLFSVLAVFVFYQFACLVSSKRSAFYAAFLLSLNPMVWFYGLWAESYTGSFFFSILSGFLIYQTMAQNSPRFFYFFSVMWAVAGGFRQDLVFFLFPFWVLGAWHLKNKKSAFISLFLFSLVSSAWLVPLIESYGGIVPYQKLVFEQFQKGMGKMEFPYDWPKAILRNAIKWGSMFLWGIGISFLILIRALDVSSKMLYQNKTLFRVLAVWFLPAFLFFTLVYFGNGGFLLVHAGAFYILLAYFLEKLKEREENQTIFFMVMSIALLSMSQFLFCAPFPDDSLFFKYLNRVFYRFTYAGIEFPYTPLHMFYS